MPGGNQINHKQEKAIAALLREPTIEAAARKAGVALRTLKGWLVLPEFAAAYATARHQILERTVDRLLATTGEAVETLRESLKADRTADRIRAAVAILEHAHKGMEAGELAREVAELRQQIEELQRANGSSPAAGGGQAQGDPDGGGQQEEDDAAAGPDQGGSEPDSQRRGDEAGPLADAPAPIPLFPPADAV
jgi:hypothetical protein